MFTVGVAVVKMRNPPVNSLSLEFLTELLISLEKLENDKTFRGIIITSVGTHYLPEVEVQTWVPSECHVCAIVPPYYRDR